MPIVWVLAPLMEGLIRFLQRLMANADPQQVTPPSAGELIQVEIAPEDINALLQQTYYVRYGLVLLMIALVLGLIWLFFMRTSRRNLQDEAEEVSAERVTMGGDLLDAGWTACAIWSIWCAGMASVPNCWRPSRSRTSTPT